MTLSTSMAISLSRLQAIVGDANVLDQAAVAQRATHHWDASPMQARALVRPTNTEQLSQVVKACHDVNQPIVTHGGLTGLVDGDKTTTNDLVVSLERMCHIESIDVAGRTMSVQAGCVLQHVQTAAKATGLLYALDLGARGSCTIGGNIATNAGGVSVLRYGMTREQILGLEVVLADGTVLDAMNALMKNNTGYDLKQLFIGSEGTLGIVTRAVLRLRPDTTTKNTAMLAFDSFEQVRNTLAHMNTVIGSQLNSFEIIWNQFYKLSTNPDVGGSLRAPLPNGFYAYAIVESQGTNEQADQHTFEQALESALEQGIISDAVIAQSEKECADIWTIRENVDLFACHHPTFSYDISLPISDMDVYLNNIKTQLSDIWPNIIMYAYGHLADSNLHITIAPNTQTGQVKVDKKGTLSEQLTEEQQQWKYHCNGIMFKALKPLRGSISAEHGIGLEKKAYLHYSRSEAEIATMRLLKQSLDPKGLLNAGKVI